MLNVFDELSHLKEDEIVEGIPIGDLLILAGFIILTIVEPD